jgi:hypothetical protein
MYPFLRGPEGLGKKTSKLGLITTLIKEQYGNIFLRHRIFHNRINGRGR